MRLSVTGGNGIYGEKPDQGITFVSCEK